MREKSDVSPQVLQLLVDMHSRLVDQQSRMVDQQLHITTIMSELRILHVDVAKVMDHQTFHETLHQQRYRSLKRALPPKTLVKEEDSDDDCSEPGKADGVRGPLRRRDS